MTQVVEVKAVAASLSRPGGCLNLGVGNETSHTQLGGGLGVKHVMYWDVWTTSWVKVSEQVGRGTGGSCY